MSTENWITGKGKLKIDGITVELELTVPTQAVPLRRMLPVLQTLTNTVVDVAVQKTVSAGQQISCTKGCGACCRQLVPLATAEVLQLNELIHQLPEPRQTQIKERFARAHAALVQAGLYDRLQQLETITGEALREFGMKYFYLGIACPFLEDESCSIHANRPLACREYLVTTPAENCAAPTAESVACIPLSTSVAQTLRTLSTPSNMASAAWVPMILATEFLPDVSLSNEEKTGQEWVGTFWQELTK